MTSGHSSLLISGLRRSGTTALWELLRSSPDLVTFDEPFHPELWTGVKNNHKGTWVELTALWPNGPQDLVPGVTPIHPPDELDPGLHPAQQAYLRALTVRDRPAVIDVVRCWNKTADIAAADPELFILQLVRGPVPWVLSHLIPSGGTRWRFAIGTRLRRATAMRRRGNFDNWQYETIFTEALARAHPVLHGLGLGADELAQAPAHVKLLAFWWATNRTLYRDLCKAAPDRHSLLLAEDFMTDPGRVSVDLLSRLGLPSGSLDLLSVRPPRRDPLQSHPAWARAFDKLGIPAALLPGHAPESDTLRAAFEEGGRA